MTPLRLLLAGSLLLSACTPAAPTTPAVPEAGAVRTEPVAQPSAAPVAQPSAPAVMLDRALVDGFVYFDAPVVDAAIRLETLDGQPIAGAVEDSYESGHFGLVVERLPGDFRVVATGGTLHGAPFDGELRAEVRGFRSNQGVHLTPFTTLVSRRMAAEPGLTLAEADRRVHAMLGVPDSFDDPMTLLFAQAYFDLDSFGSQVQAAGGPVAMLTSLEAALANGSTRSFAPKGYRVLSGELGQAVEWLGRKAFEAGAGKVGGAIFESILSAAGYQNDVTKSLQAIRSELQSLKNELGVVRDEIKAEIAQVAYDGSVFNSYLIDFERHNQTVLDNMIRLGAADASETAFVKEKRAELERSLAPFAEPDVFQKWEQIMTGSSQSDGLVKLWNKAINAKSPRYFKYRHAQQVQANWDNLDHQLAITVLAVLTAKNLPSGGKLDNQSAQVREVFTRWHQVRRAGAKLVRGGVSEPPAMLDLLGQYGLSPAEALRFQSRLPNEAFFIDKQNNWMLTNRSVGAPFNLPDETARFNQWTKRPREGDPYNATADLEKLPASLLGGYRERLTTLSGLEGWSILSGEQLIKMGVPFEYGFPGWEKVFKSPTRQALKNVNFEVADNEKIWLPLWLDYFGIHQWRFVYYDTNGTHAFYDRRKPSKVIDTGLGGMLFYHTLSDAERVDFR